MDNSILNDIKKLLGIIDEYTQFDRDIIIHINSAFTILNQLGVGPKEPFCIEDSSSKWSDFIDDTSLEVVKDFIYFRVRLAFDPPTNSFLVDAITKQIDELTWRMNVMVDKEVE